MEPLDELIDILEEAVDRLLLSGVRHASEGTLAMVGDVSRRFEDAGLLYGSELATKLSKEIEKHRVTFEENKDSAVLLFKLQSYCDAARSVRHRERLRENYEYDPIEGGKAK